MFGNYTLEYCVCPWPSFCFLGLFLIVLPGILHQDLENYDLRQEMIGRLQPQPARAADPLTQVDFTSYFSDPGTGFYEMAQAAEK